MKIEEAASELGGGVSMRKMECGKRSRCDETEQDEEQACMAATDESEEARNH